MDGSAWVVVIATVVGFFGPFTLMVLRLRRIRRYGVSGGEFNHPLAPAGYGGVPPGTVIQEDFGGATTTQTQSVGGEAGSNLVEMLGYDSTPRRTSDRRSG